MNQQLITLAKTNWLQRLFNGRAMRCTNIRQLLLFAVTVSCFFAAGASVAQPPMVNFTPEDGTPGIQLPFNTSNGFDPFAGDVTINYGRQSPTGGNFGWNADPFQSTSSTDPGGSSLARYVPTLYFDNETQDPNAQPGVAMLEDQDWGFHMEFQHRGPYLAAGNNEFLMFTKHAPLDWGGVNDGREDRIFNLRRGVDANDWAIMAGDASGGWSPVVTGLQHPEEYIDFDVHFRADADIMDFYWEGELVGSASTGHGRYDIDFLQFEYREPWGGVMDFRNFRLGHNLSDAPPPSIDGDYNSDGIVDAGDYVVWRKNENTAGFPGSVIGDGDDGTGTGTPDGIVDDSDYDFWVSQFGATTPLGAGGDASAVPEPSAAILLMFFSIVMAPTIRWR
jgi:hypothetical protein